MGASSTPAIVTFAWPEKPIGLLDAWNKATPRNGPELGAERVDAPWPVTVTVSAVPCGMLMITTPLPLTDPLPLTESPPPSIT